jgi:hypothetical protein
LTDEEVWWQTLGSIEYDLHEIAGDNWMDGFPDELSKTFARVRQLLDTLERVGIRLAEQAHERYQMYGND